VTAFDRLHPAVQHHIVNSLGWRELRPLQEAAIEPVLAGMNVLCLAPTAGGKTEAAVLPLLSRALTENWAPLSVLYVCPIKALLNNLHIRLHRYAELLGRRVGLWHGDVGDAERRRLARDPPDILLTTPESLEVMLVSRRVDHWNLFERVRAVVVDEIHAFAGDDRGWHLLAVLDRVSRLCSGTVQRIGLSATVGNPQELLDWLGAGSGLPGAVVSPVATSSVSADIEVDYVGNVANAALVISRLHRGEKRLVFCDSRSQVEQLAGELRRLEVQTFVSHSSLSVDERRRAESAFVEGQDCVIVATSTLELGIDVGDLDRVIQLDAPHTVSAFLQRLGRTGRRSGSRRNCLFLATEEGALLRALGILRLWAKGYVEPVTPPAKPYHVLAQQLMATLLQEGGMGRADWMAMLRGFLRAADIGTSECQQLQSHMLAAQYLFEDSGLLSVGLAGERQFGRRNFLELYSVFDSPPLLTVHHGRAELGQVHELSFHVRQNGPLALSLGGRHWRVTHVDWRRRSVYVEPTEQRGSSRWLGAGQPLLFTLCQAILAILAGEPPTGRISSRAQAMLVELRDQHPWAAIGTTALVRGENATTWWNFGGGLLNAALAQRLGGKVSGVSSDDFGLRIRSNDAGEDLRQIVHSLLASDPKDLSVGLTDEAIDDLKFGDCVPQELLARMAQQRYSVAEAWRELKDKALRTVGVS